MGNLDTAFFLCSALGFRLGLCILSGRCSPGQFPLLSASLANRALLEPSVNSGLACPEHFSRSLNDWERPQEIGFQLLICHLCFLHGYLGKILVSGERRHTLGIEKVCECGLWSSMDSPAEPHVCPGGQHTCAWKHPWSMQQKVGKGSGNEGQGVGKTAILEPSTLCPGPAGKCFSPMMPTPLHRDLVCRASSRCACWGRR